MKSKYNFQVKYNPAIIIEEGSLLRLPEIINSGAYFPLPRRFILVVDRAFHDANGDLLGKFVKDIKSEALIWPFESGENAKSLPGLMKILDFCSKNSIKRDDAIGVIGGGTLCDMIAFAASVYLRGIHMINIPTTLISCVDPVFGKAAINHGGVKNLIGSYFVPDLTLIDVSFLKKDSRRYYVTGIAEVIKSAFIDSKRSVDELEADMAGLVGMDNGIIDKYVKLGIKVKTSCVLGDELGLRGKHFRLSLGHNLADILEMADLPDRLTHGESVALGMIFAAYVNGRINPGSSHLLSRTKALISAAGLPTRPNSNAIQPDKILDLLRKSKKNYDKGISLVVLNDYGKVDNANNVDPEIVKEGIGYLINE